MGLLGKIFGADGGGSSSSSTSTTNADDRIAADNGAVATSGDGNVLNLTIQDGGLSAKALEAGNAAINASSISAMSSAGVSTEAMHIVKNAMIDTAELTRDSLADMLKANVRVQEIAAGQAAAAVSDSFAFSSRTTAEALAGVTTANRESLTFADRLNRDSLELADRAQGNIAKSAADSLGMIRSVVDMAMKSADLSQQGSANAVNQVARAYDTATNYQAEKATTDSRYLVIAGLVVVGIAAMRMMK